MALIPEKQTKTFTLTPAGTHIARLIQIIQIGKIETEWQGQKKTLEKIRLTFELLEETHVFKEGEDPQPFIASEEYTLNMGSKSNLRPIVEGIIGTTLLDQEADAFDVEDLLGKACLITIKHNAKGDKTYANIASTAPLMKGQVAKEAYNPLTKLTYANWSQDTFDKLPKFIQDKMRASEQFKKIGNPGDTVISTIAPEDIPF